MDERRSEKERESGPERMELRILFVADDESYALQLLGELRRSDSCLVHRRVDHAEALLEALAEPWDIVISDYGLPRFDARSALRIVGERMPGVPFLVVSAAIGEAAAVELMKAGAHDCLMVDRLVRLASVLERELRDAEVHRRRGAAAEASQMEVRIAASLARAGRELLSTFDFAELTERATRVTRELLGAGECRTFLRDAEAGTYMLQAADPPRNGSARVSIESIESIEPGEVTRWFPAPCNGEPLELGRAAPQSTGWGTQGASALAIPLCRGGEVSGVQIAVREDAAGGFGEEEKRIARAVGQLASVAIENARFIAELERANRLRSDFVATMSHELRTPLNVIIGYDDLLLEGEFGGLSREQQEVVRRADRSAHEILDLINATLDLSRLDVGRLPLDVQPIDFGVLLDGMGADWERMRQRKPILALEWSVAEVMPAIRSDPVKLKVVVKNLVGNAMKFTERGGVAVRVAPAKGGVEIAVADSGVGIAAEELESIFDPLVQVSGARGLGLGLYIVRRLLDALGGTMSVDSELGRGSTFRVQLPAAPPDPARLPSGR